MTMGATVIYPETVAENDAHPMAQTIDRVCRQGFREESFATIEALHQRVTVGANPVINADQITVLKTQFEGVGNEFYALVYDKVNNYHRGIDYDEVSLAMIQATLAAGANWIHLPLWIEMLPAQYALPVESCMREYDGKTWAEWGTGHFTFGTGVNERRYVPTLYQSTYELASVVTPLLVAGYTIKTATEFRAIQEANSSGP